MGLAAGQARYLFISNRITDIQGSLMINSARQMRLADEASDIAEAKEAALNCTHYEFNGNAEFDYDSFMGESAMNSDKGLYFLLTNDGNNRVVLNNTYARGMRAAGINEEGGSETPAGLYAFMNAVVGSPKSVSDWNEVSTGIKTVTADEVAAWRENWLKNKENELKAAVQNFDTTYGVKAPQNGTYPVKEGYTEYSYISSTDFAKKLGKANLTGGQTNGHTSTNRDIENLNGKTWEQIMTGTESVLYLGNYETTNYNYQNDIVSKVHTVIQNLGNTVKSAIPSIPANKVDTAVQKTKQQYSQNSRDFNSNENYDNFINQSSNSSTSKIESSQSRDSGTYHHSETRYAVDLKDLLNYFYNQLKDAMGSATDNVLCNGTAKERVKSYESYKNEAGKTYQEWNNAYNALSQEVKNYRANGTLPAIPAMPTQYVNAKDDDKKVLANYEQIFVKACQNGWKEDGNLTKDNLTQKLVNNQYLINNNNVTETAKMSTDFVNVKTNNKDDVIAHYEREEKKIKSQEKKNRIKRITNRRSISKINY